MYSPQRTIKPSPLSYISPTSTPTRQFRQGSTQYTTLSPGSTSPGPRPTSRGNDGSRGSSDFGSRGSSDFGNRGSLDFGGGNRPRSDSASRSTSNNFNQLSQRQIQELRESFHVLDKDGDGVISADDLKDMLASFGQDTSASTIANYLNSVPKPFSLASYLSVMSTHLANLSPRDDLLSAFAAFDESDDGQIDMDLLAESLSETGMSTADIERVCRGWTSRKPGMGMKGGEKFRYREFVDAVSGKPAEGQV